MKVLTWNCNGAFRNKFTHLAALQADIYIVQECEDPTQTKHTDYLNWATNYMWIGDNKNKGLGIFAAAHIKLEPLNWSSNYQDHSVKYFLPCLVNNDFQLIGIWAHYNNSPTFGYIGQVWKYLQVNQQHLTEVVLAGDFNSNAIWDRWDRWWNHNDVVRSLQEKGIDSLYHRHLNEEQGKESIPTFYLNRNPARPYHIDYVFGSSRFTNSLTKLEIGSPEQWLQVSDHLPVSCEFNAGIDCVNSLN